MWSKHVVGAAVCDHFGPGGVGGRVACRLASGRWRRVAPGVLVTHSGPLTWEQRLWVPLLAAGNGAVLAGLTAARLDGLEGFEDPRTHLLIPASRRVRKPLADVAVHRSRRLTPGDVHPLRRPPRTRIARSIVDAAAWAATDRAAQAVLAAGVQQRLTRAADVGSVLEQSPRVRRRGLMLKTLADVAGGAEALSELDFCALVRRCGLGEAARHRRDRRALAYGRGCLVVGYATGQRVDRRRVPGTAVSGVRRPGEA
jgi:hypothetical protein